MSFARTLLILALGVAATVLRAQSTTPTASTTIPRQNLTPGGAQVTVDLRNHFTLPDVTGQIVQFNTVMGRFNFELFDDTPISRANFLSYVTSGAYANTIIHRSVPGFVVQGGGYTNSVTATHIPVSAPIRNEFRRPNVRGTVAMAKVGGNPDSATSEWFVNLADNRANLDNQNGGFTVFARVLGNGIGVFDSIASLQTASIAFTPAVSLTDVPVRNITTGQTQLLLQNLIAVNTVTPIPLYPAANGDTAVLSFSVTSSSPANVDATVRGSTLVLTPGAGAAANTGVAITVTATDTHGSTASQTFSVSLGGTDPVRAPTITAQPPATIRLPSGTSNTVVFSVTATGTPAPTYQWRRNGVAVTGQRSPTYVLTNASDAQAGTFTCVVDNGQGSVTSDPCVLSFVATAPADRARLINLSILTTLAANETLTMGTVLGGAGTSGNKAILARAAGPALSQLGVTGVLPDPQMSLLTAGTGAAIATNNDWAGAANLTTAFSQVGAFAYAAANSKDAAITQPSLAPGGYTVQVSDVSGGSGQAIAEIYDSTPASAVTLTTPRLVNVSVLKQIPGGVTLTAGFVIGGTTAKTLLVRAIGPTLASFGLTETMPDPTLQLFNASSVKIAENDNWGGDPGLTAAGDAVAAFRLSNNNSGDAVLLATLAPGNYTAQVTGANGNGGVALVEIYEIP